MIVPVFEKRPANVAVLAIEPTPALTNVPAPFSDPPANAALDATVSDCPAETEIVAPLTKLLIVALVLKTWVPAENKIVPAPLNETPAL